MSFYSLQADSPADWEVMERIVLQMIDQQERVEEQLFRKWIAQIPKRDIRPLIETAYQRVYSK